MSGGRLAALFSQIGVAVACATSTPMNTGAVAIPSATPSTAVTATASAAPSRTAESPPVAPAAVVHPEPTTAPLPLESRAVMPDVDYWATPQPVVDKMLELAHVTASDIVYDLGCGDARSLITAAERYGAKGVGFDIDPRLVNEARESARHHHVENLVRIEQANIFGLDLSGADVIFLYITPRFNLRLVPQFEKMRRGSRIVSHEFEIPGAKPMRTVKVLGPPDGPPDSADPDAYVSHTIYLWRMPWKKQHTDWKAE